MNESKLLEADVVVRSLRDTFAEDNLLDTAINMMAEMADFLLDERSLLG